MIRLGKPVAVLPWRPIKKIYCRNIGCIKLTNLTLKLQLQSLHWSFRFIPAVLESSLPLYGDQTFYWSINDSWWQHQMSVRALRHGTPMARQFGGFPNPWVCLQAFRSFLPHLLPALLLASFFMGPCSLLGNRVEMRATQARNFCVRFDLTVFWLSSHLLNSRHPVRKSKFGACAVSEYCYLNIQSALITRAFTNSNCFLFPFLLRTWSGIKS